MSERSFVFCPYCGTRLEARQRYAETRPVCPACGFIYFRDPKVAVIGLVVWGRRVLLVRRGVDPEKGKWALPGGFMDAGELPEGALARELAEETGLAIEVTGLNAIFPMQNKGQASRGIVLVYNARPQEVEEDIVHDGVQDPSPALGDAVNIRPALPKVRPGDDVMEAGWFAADELPSELAFESTVRLLADWQSRSSTLN